MKIGIIGTRWGRVHCGTFREAGCEIAALVGRDPVALAEAAAAEGVECYSTDSEVLADCDAIVIASPTSTHLDYLHQFADKPVLCEKPLAGRRIDAAAAQLRVDDHYVNFAFPFLRSAQLLSSLINQGQLGQIERILLNVGAGFEADKGPVDWLLDISAHPLSYLLHQFGPFVCEQHHIGSGVANLSVLMTQEARMLNLNHYVLPYTGIQIDLTVIGDAGVARLNGGFRPASQWQFAPLLLNDVAVNAGDSDPRDIWYLANCEVVRRFVAKLRHQASHQQLEAEGMFSVARAAQLEQMLAPLLSE